LSSSVPPDGDSLAISVAASDAAVRKHFQARMPYGLMMPELEAPP
jgi:hypothetical protein